MGTLGDATSGRLLGVAEFDAATNMAVDQVVLDSVDQSGLPTLRFYRWREPSLSLGYFQPLAGRAQHGPSERLPVVRRATGGGAIVHHRELTYSLAIPIDRRRAGGLEWLYELVHGVIIEVLAEIGCQARPFHQVGGSLCRCDPFLCFQRRTREDLIVSGYKVVGSAQRRGRNAVLQHGSILMRASEFAPELPGIENVTSIAVPTPSELGEAIAAQLAARCNIRWQHDEITVAEFQQAEVIAKSRFAAPAWTSRR